MKYHSLLAIALFAQTADAALGETCDPENRSFVCGVDNAEDLVHVAGTSWIVANEVNWKLSDDGMKFGAGPLRAIRSDTREVHTLFPSSDTRVNWDERTYPDCSTPPKILASHGLNISPIDQSRFRLYVVNHGEKESIEVIDLEASANHLLATWRGCLHTPAGARASSVAPLSNGRVVVSLLGGAGPAIWTPGKGWTKIPGLGEYDHGMEVSPDGKWLFLALHRKDGAVIRVPIEGGVAQTILRTDYVPDSLRWGEDGQLYVAGYSSEDARECLKTPTKICDAGFAIETINPGTLETKQIIRTAGLQGAFGAATTALQFDQELWVGTWFGDRIAILRPER